MQAHRRETAVAIALALVLQSSAVAQAGDDEVRRAFRTSLVGTAIPIVLGTAMIAASDTKGGQAVAGYAIASLGLSAGPALGHWRLGNGKTGWVGSGGRLLLAWGSVALAAAALGDCDFWTCTGDQYETAGLILVVGHAAAALWALRDLGSLGGFTLWRPKRPRPQFSVAPTYVPGARAPGLLLRAEF